MKVSLDHLTEDGRIFLVVLHILSANYLKGTNANV